MPVPKTIARVPKHLHKQAIEMAATATHTQFIADRLGISRRTLARVVGERADDLLERQDGGEELSPEDSAELDFALMFREARARAGQVLEAGVGGESWKPNAWLLERQHRSAYAATVKTELSGPEGGPVETRVTHDVDPESLLSLLRAMG
jgi:hypothetical protein